MPLLERNDGLTVAREIVKKSPAAETEVVIDASMERFVRFGDTGPSQAVERDRMELAIRARVGTPGAFQEARATAGSLEPAAWKAALERAVELAKVAPPNPELAPLGGPVALPITMRDRATLDHSFEAKARWVRMAMDAAREYQLLPAGLAQTSGVSRVVANSRGREVHGYSSRAAFALTCVGRSGEGWAEHIARAVGAIKAESVVQRAVDKALRSQDPIDLEPGAYTVVLEPAAVAALLLFATYQGFGAREVEDQASFLCGRMGTRCLSELVSVADDPKCALYPALPFDGEGTPRQRTTLIERGTPMRPVTDRNYAAKRGEESTGHALPQPSTHGPMPQNLVLAAGESSTEDLIAGVERGLLVSRLHYVNMIEPRELALTGMTRGGTFLIENGKVGRAVVNLRFTDTLVRILSAVRAVGREQQVAGALFDGESVQPALLVDGFRFTSSTDF